MKTALKTILNRIFNTENKQKIAKNSGWLILDYGIKVFLGLVIGVWVARYLGPTDFGKLNYVIALISLFAPLYRLGLDATIPKELIHREKQQEEILCSTFFLKFTGAVLICILGVITIHVLHPDDRILKALAIFIGFSFIFKSFETMDIWFLNKLKSKYTIIARNTGRIISAALKIFFIMAGFSLVYFGFALCLESFVAAVAFVILFIKTEPYLNFKNIKLTFHEPFMLLKSSWVFVILGFAYSAFVNIDKIMVENMLGAEQVGLYSISGMVILSFAVLASTIIRSTYPILVKLEKDKPFEHYARDYQKLFNYFALFAYLIVIFIYFSSPFIIKLVWGNEYAFSASILSVQIFSVIFIFLGICLNLWIMVKDLYKYLITTFLSGLLLNIVLNYFLIIRLGVIGVAYATVISYFAVYLLAGFFHPDVRTVSKIQLKALFMVDLFRTALRKLKFIPK